MEINWAFWFFLLVGILTAVPVVTADVAFDNWKSWNADGDIVTIKDLTGDIGTAQILPCNDISTIQHCTVPFGTKEELLAMGQPVMKIKIHGYEDYKDVIASLEVLDMKNNKEKVNKNYEWYYETTYIVSEPTYNITNIEITDAEGTRTEPARIQNGTKTVQKKGWTKLQPNDLKKNSVATIGLFLDVNKEDHYDGVPTIFGVEIDEWAAWSSDLITGLVAGYHLNESSGNTALDVRGDHDATGHSAGVVEGDTGLINASAHFDGGAGVGINISTLIDVKDQMDYQGAVSFWYKSDTSKVNGAFIKFGDANNDHSQFYVNDNKMYILIKDSGGNILYWQSAVYASLDDGDWQHMVWTVSNSTGQQFYLNGVNQTNGTYTIGGQGTKGALTLNPDMAGTEGYIGMGEHKTTDSTWELKGNLDMMYIFNRTITSSEVSFLYNSGAGVEFEEAGGAVDNPPEIVMNLPVDEYTTGQYTVTHSCNVTDDINLVNVSLVINGTTESTNTSGLNNSIYFFDHTYTDGYYNWTCLAYDNSTQSTIDAGRGITISNVGPQIIDLIMTPLNSSREDDGRLFNTSNIEEIEYAQINFTLYDAEDDDIIGDIDLYYTANGTQACTPGNKQTNTCFNYSFDKWIQYHNGTDTPTFNDEGAVGDFIQCTYTYTNSSWREYTCLIDEHYNPNIMKWYDAEYNFSDVKWQTTNNQGLIHLNDPVRIELADPIIPLNADQYKLDFRVQAVASPSQPLEAYLCNSTYLTGAVVGNQNCAIVASKAASELQDDGTKFRGVFTKELIDEINDIKYVVLRSSEPSASKGYGIKTYDILAGGYNQKWAYSTNSGSTYTNLSDGYETELNVNWFYNGADPTELVFKINSTDDQGNEVNSTEYNLTWDIDPAQNYAPIISINGLENNPQLQDTISINWTEAEPNDDELNVSVYIINTTATYTLATNLPNGTLEADWNTSLYADGSYNITVLACENATAQTLCSSSNRTGITTQNADVFLIGLVSPATGSTATNPEVNFTSNATSPLDLINVSLFTNIGGTWTRTNTSDRVYQDGVVTSDSGTVNVPDTADAWERQKQFSGLNDYVTNATYTVSEGIGIRTQFILDNGTQWNVTRARPIGAGTYSDSNGFGIDEKVVEVSFWGQTVDGSRTVSDFKVNGKIATTTADFSFNATITTTTTWNYEYCNANGCNMSESNYTVNADIVDPLITLTGPISEFIKVNASTIFLNYSIVETSGPVCWYQYNSINNTFDCTASAEEFTYIYPNEDLIVWANDSFGNEDSASRTWDYEIVVLDETFDSEILETSPTTFEIDVYYNSTKYSDIAANLTYDSTEYTSTKSGGGDLITFTRQITTPSVSGSEEKSFYWNITLTNSTGDFYGQTTTQNQTVTGVIIQLCTPGGPVDINITTYNQEGRTPLNATMNVAFSYFDVAGSGDDPISDSFSDTTELNNTWHLCISPNSSNYTVDLQAQADASAFTQNNYFVEDYNTSSGTLDILMYLLNDSAATLTETKIVDRAFEPIVGVLTYIQKYDIGTDSFFTVDMTKSSFDGKDLVYLNWYDTWYRFVVVANGTTELTTTSKKVAETPLTFQIYDTEAYTYRKFLDIEYDLTFNDTSSIFTLTYVMPSSDVTSGCLQVIKRNATNDYDICVECETSVSATLYCDVSAEGNGTFIARFYGTGSIAPIDNLIEIIGSQNNLYELIGNDDGTGLAIIMAGVVLSFFLFSPILAVVGMLLGVLGAIALGLQPLSISAFVGIVIIGGVVILLMKK